MKVLPGVLVLAISAGAAAANDFEPSMRGYVEKQVLGWIADPVLVEAIRRQNAEMVGVTEARIAELDSQWRSEIGQQVRPTIEPVIGNSASDFLRLQVAASAGVISEVFVMDRVGLNVAASDTTSDYWQGDEAKFTESFGHGGALFIDEVEFDESTQSYLGQVSVEITDPDTGQAIGAVTVGLNAEMLF